MTDFIFLGSQIPTNGDCSHKIKRHLLLGRKAVTNLDSVLQSRDIILLTKVLLALTSPEYSLEGLMLKRQDFGHLMQIVDSLEKTLILGKIECRRKRGQQRTRWLNDITD